MKVTVPKPLFDKMCDGNQCTQISEGYVNKTFFFRNKEIVITGTKSSASGFTEIWGHYIVDIEHYNGDLKPLNRDDHWKEVQQNKRERGYKAQKTKFGKRTIVFIGDVVTFVSTYSDVQLQLFDV